jgi:hypothetical protein
MVKGVLTSGLSKFEHQELQQRQHTLLSKSERAMLMTCLFLTANTFVVISLLGGTCCPCLQGKGYQYLATTLGTRLRNCMASHSREPLISIPC